MSKAKKTLLIVVAMVLVSVISIAATLAYLNQKTDALTNTFIGSSGLVTGFTLQESVVATDGSGNYVKGTGTVTAGSGQNYSGLKPGATLYKDPKVSITTVTEKAYVFIEVVGTLPSEYTWSVDSANWTLISGLTGPQGGNVYEYKNGVLAANTSSFSKTILTGNQITVKSDVTSVATSQQTLKFYAYVCQAEGYPSGIDTSAEIFQANFAS